MNRHILIGLISLSACVNSYAQPNKAKWGLTDNLNMISFKRLNSFLSVPDIQISQGDIEIRLYCNPKHNVVASMTSLIYKNNQWSATYYSRRHRSVDDSVDATFPINISNIKHKNLDSIFLSLVMHNVFILPDQSQTSRPQALAQNIVLTKTNEQIRAFRFEGTGLIDEGDSQEFREYKAIAELFFYLTRGIPEKL